MSGTKLSIRGQQAVSIPLGRGPESANGTSAHEPTGSNEVALTGLHPLAGHTKSGAAWEVHRGDVRKVLPAFKENSFHCVVTSPPYFWQRDYNVEGQIGKEQTIEGYVNAVAGAMDDVKRVLREDGVLFLNMGDTY